MNKEIKCPNCQKAFQVDEAGFASILKQVRDDQFDSELSTRMAVAEREKNTAVELAKTTTKGELQQQLAALEKQLQQEINLKQQENTEMRAKFNAHLNEKLQEKELEIVGKNALLERKEKDFELTLAQKLAEKESLLHNKESELNKLELKLENSSTEKKLEIAEAVKALEKERDDYANKIQLKEAEARLQEKAITEEFQNKLQLKDQSLLQRDDEIARLKDFKQKLSTKMIGETLEQHCEAEFNKIRATGFQNAYFEKDNDASTGYKGDYIYKEHDVLGQLLLEIECYRPH